MSTNDANYKLNQKTPYSSALKYYEGKQILVTGGRGYIGSALSQTLATIDCNLNILDRSKSNVWIPKGLATVSILTGDVRDRSVWDKVLPDVDIVFHLAQQEYVECNPLKDFEMNALPTIHLCESCKANDFSPLVIYSSSVNLYGQVKNLPVSEKLRDDPLIPWAVHKQMSENYLHVYANKYDLPSIILRLANVYGPIPRQDVMFKPVVNAVIRDAILGKSLKLYPNANCVRDYVFIDDVVKALLLAAKLKNIKNGEIFNVGSSVGLVISEAWEIILELVSNRLSVKGSIEEIFDKVEPFGLRNFVADITRFSNLTGWQPETFFKNGVEMTVEHIITMP